MQHTYRFVEVPLVGYVLHEDSFTFGYREYFKEIDAKVELYVEDKQHVSQLEYILDKELAKGKMKTVAEGIGGLKGDIYLASRMGSLFLAFGLEESRLMQSLLPLVLVPGPVYPLLGAYIFKRLGEKGAFRQMKDKLHDHVTEYDTGPICREAARLSLSQKIRDFSAAKKQGNFWKRTRRVCTLEPSLDKQRDELVQSWSSLMTATKAAYDAAQDKAPYDTALHVYSTCCDIYKYTWWQKTPVIFSL
ncbi:hypothetical protein HY639_02365 [Candidatus Woesearchaeota archaeon]|nr:hypothetical protein [Candidatus Woesearchaeota archaeon]